MVEGLALSHTLAHALRPVCGFDSQISPAFPRPSHWREGAEVAAAGTGAGGFSSLPSRASPARVSTPRPAVVPPNNCFSLISPPTLGHRCTYFCESVVISGRGSKKARGSKWLACARSLATRLELGPRASTRGWASTSVPPGSTMCQVSMLGTVYCWAPVLFCF